jgi:hypothetical protein
VQQPMQITDPISAVEIGGDGASRANGADLKQFSCAGGGINNHSWRSIP